MNYEQSAKAQTERLMADGHATILAIESSCDETAAAIVRDGRQVISSVISSQIPLHAMYGGVVPEIASRAHVESVDPVVDEALKKAGMTLADVDAVAVTYAPGLIGAVLVGVNFAKAAALGAYLAPGSDAGAWAVPHGKGGLDEQHWLREALGSDADAVLERGAAEIRKRF